MIRYSLACEDGHAFESWFADAAAFDRLAAAGQLSCAVCGAPGVKKALMAPQVAPSGKGVLAATLSPAEEALAALRHKVESESEYVGLSFAAEARAMHEGEKPERPIYGEARPDEARSLIEDGIPVAPLPFRPTRKSN